MFWGRCPTFRLTNYVIQKLKIVIQSKFGFSIATEKKKKKPKISGKKINPKNEQTLYNDTLKATEEHK